MRRGKRLAISVFSGLIAIALTLWYGASVRGEAERERQELLAAYGGDLVSVCVAARDIDAGETLDEGNVRTEEWVAGLLPDDAVTSPEDVIGKRATSAIPERAVLCPAYLQSRGGGLDIPKGFVAVSVGVDSVHAVGGSVRPGTDVDVYVSADSITDVLCRAQVIDTSSERDGSNADALSWVTLAIEPERVEEVLTATARGSIFLAAPGDGVGEVEAERADGAYGMGGDA